MLGGALLATTWILGGCGAGLNQTSITCPEGRTLLDGVCVAEQVADYVACVRAQGAQLDAAKSQEISAEAGYAGIKAGGAAEVSESLAKKYSASDQAMMAIIDACNNTANLTAQAARKKQEVAAGSLVAHWRFDEKGGNGLSDASGNGNNGVIHGAPIWVDGRIGGALKFDGASHVAVKHDASLHSAHALTLAAWFLASEEMAGDPKTSWRPILWKEDPPDKREYALGILAEERVVHAFAGPVDSDPPYSALCNGDPHGSVQFGKWHHAATVISPATRSISVYLDGVLMSTCELSQAGLRKTGTELKIGGAWIGMLDEIRIYAKALSDEEVQALAKSGEREAG